MLKCLVTPDSIDGQHIHRLPESLPVPFPVLSLIISDASHPLFVLIFGEGNIDVASWFGRF